MKKSWIENNTWVFTLIIAVITLGTSFMGNYASTMYTRGQDKEKLEQNTRDICNIKMDFSELNKKVYVLDDEINKNKFDIFTIKNDFSEYKLKQKVK